MNEETLISILFDVLQFNYHNYSHKHYLLNIFLYLKPLNNLYVIKKDDMIVTNAAMLDTISIFRYVSPLNRKRL